ncbi:hypothetical protein P8452_26294 [Trifolium repens]|nr:hypothetical protein P8452_26294 [Trifolium repens]
MSSMDFAVSIVVVADKTLQNNYTIFSFGVEFNLLPFSKFTIFLTSFFNPFSHYLHLFKFQFFLLDPLILPTKNFIFSLSAR